MNKVQIGLEMLPGYYAVTFNIQQAAYLRAITNEKLNEYANWLPFLLFFSVK